MKIAFILPGLIKIPIGGVKVIYRYAGELAKLGHKVTIISPRAEGYRLRDLIKAMAVKLRDRRHGLENKPYYNTPKNVEHIIIPAPDAKFIPDGDVIIATGWQTAYWVDAMPKEKGEKFYFIQNYETYQGDREKIQYTWKLPLTKIVIAQWLKKKAEELGEDVLGPIPNAIDPQEFYITQPIKDRSPIIVMLYHRFLIKGSQEGISVLKKVKQAYPELKATLFCARSPGITLPEWISLELRPDVDRLREIYNSAAIFLHPSHREGWPLPPAESMACGCAVVAAANEGVQEYITHKKTGLLCPIGDIDSLFSKIIQLLANPDQRTTLAKTGRENILRYSWGKNAKQLEKVIIDRL